MKVQSHYKSYRVLDAKCAQVNPGFSHDRDPLLFVFLHMTDLEPGKALTNATAKICLSMSYPFVCFYLFVRLSFLLPGRKAVVPAASRRSSEGVQGCR